MQLGSPCFCSSHPALLEAQLWLVPCGALVAFREACECPSPPSPQERARLQPHGVALSEEGPLLLRPHGPHQHLQASGAELGQGQGQWSPQETRFWKCLGWGPRAVGGEDRQPLPSSCRNVLSLWLPALLAAPSSCPHSGTGDVQLPGCSLLPTVTAELGGGGHPARVVCTPCPSGRLADFQEQHQGINKHGGNESALLQKRFAF